MSQSILITGASSGLAEGIAREKMSKSNWFKQFETFQVSEIGNETR